MGPRQEHGPPCSFPRWIGCSGPCEQPERVGGDLGVSARPMTTLFGRTVCTVSFPDLNRQVRRVQHMGSCNNIYLNSLNIDDGK
jgi:hypothetical protein